MLCLLCTCVRCVLHEHAPLTKHCRWDRVHGVYGMRLLSCWAHESDHNYQRNHMHVNRFLRLLLSLWEALPNKSPVIRLIHVVKQPNKTSEHAANSFQSRHTAKASRTNGLVTSLALAFNQPDSVPPTHRRMHTQLLMLIAVRFSLNRSLAVPDRVDLISAHAGPNVFD